MPAIPENNTPKRIKNCAKCQADFQCKPAKGCWCEEISLSSQQLELLSNTYGNCLCRNCLKQIETESMNINLVKWIQFSNFAPLQTNGPVAERLGRGLQNLVQRFKSARDLQKKQKSVPKDWLLFFNRIFWNNCRYSKIQSV